MSVSSLPMRRPVCSWRGFHRGYAARIAGRPQLVGVPLFAGALRLAGVPSLADVARSARALRFALLLLAGASTVASATEVTFRFRPEGTPGAVSVAGYFNGWSVEASPLADPDGDGLWELSVDLSPGRHPYKFVVDGTTWITDATAPEFEDDGFGGKNSVLLVGEARLVVEGVPGTLAADGSVVPLDAPVRFRFRPEGGAGTVSVAGTFNEWSTTATPLAGPDDAGVWEAVLRLDPGRYAYKFVVDGGRWITDLTAAAFEDDGFGGENSVLVVGTEPIVVGVPIAGSDPALLGPLVTFRFAPGGGRPNAVSVAGSFDDWNAAAHPLADPDRDGVWEARFRLPAGTYAYEFVLDGDDWVVDPFAEETEPNAFGGLSGRFTVAASDFLVGCRE